MPRATNRRQVCGSDQALRTRLSADQSDAAAPVYRYLKSAKPGLLGTEAIKWNFTKFLVDRAGNVVARFAPNDTPESIERDVAKAL